MIGRIRGILLEKQAPELLLDVNAVGYEIQAPMTTFYDLPALGEEVSLYTHLVVREDAHILYGFLQELDRKLFRLLIKVNGIGPRLALAILSSIRVDDFVVAVKESNTAALVRLPGIGKKTAERLLIEMRDRISALGELSNTLQVEQRVVAANSNKQKEQSEQTFIADPLEEAQTALLALGFKVTEISKMLSKLNTHNKTSEEVIKMALKQVVA